MRLTHVGPILKVWIWMKHKDGELWKRVKSTGENIFIFFPPLPLVSHKNADPHCPHQARKFSIRLSEKEQKVLSKSTNVRSLNFGSRQRPAYSALLLIKVLGEKWLKRTDFCVEASVCMCGGLSAFSQVTGTNQTRLLSRWPDSWRSPCVGLLADGWSGFPTQLRAFYFTYTHTCTNTHI